MVSSLEMKAVRVIATKHIFTQCNKSKNISDKSFFDKYSVDVSDIEDDGRF